MADLSTPSITSRKDYPETPRGKWEYYSDELKGSKKLLRRWHKQGDRIMQRYLDQRTAQTVPGDASTGFRLNLFHTNVITLQALLYNNVPKVDVTRRHDDANDDAGRVAAEIMERVLNNDVANNEEQYDSVLRATLQDRLLPGLGIARVRYDVVTTTNAGAKVEGDAEDADLTNVVAIKKVVSESAPLDYFHWRDVLWGWTRTFADLPWLAFRSYMTKDEFTKRFSKKAADDVTFKQQKVVTDDKADAPDSDDTWMKTEVWEVWDKSKRKIVWISLDHPRLLDEKEDPLKLRNFFPTPAFFLANQTTSLYLPTPDWHMAQDLYNEIDKLQTRIAILTEAVKVVGVYDASTPEVQRMLKEGVDNDLIPVDKWAMFAEKGGLQGAVDWLPLTDVVNALLQLRQLRDETITLLYQVTGMSDVMRGQLDNQYEGVGQSEMKTQYGSVRVQALQQQYATFASGLMQIKAEIIQKHFDVETIVRQSSITSSFETPELVQAALALIKSPEARLRVSIKAESLAMVDWQGIKAERTEFLTALGAFLQSAAPMIEQNPTTAPFMLKMLQWGLAGFKGSETIEGVVDQAIKSVEEAQAQAAQNPPPPDPEEIKAQAAQQMEQMKQEGQLAQIQAKTSAELETRQADMFADIETRSAEHEMSMAEKQADIQSELVQIQAKAESDIQVELATSRINAEQQAEGVENEVNKGIIEHRLDMEKLAATASAKITEARAVAEVKNIPRSNDE